MQIGHQVYHPCFSFGHLLIKEPHLQENKQITQPMTVLHVEDVVGAKKNECTFLHFWYLIEDSFLFYKKGIFGFENVPLMMMDGCVKRSVAAIFTLAFT